MKLLNKKERVFDFQLTPYGRHKLSVGNFRPTYYAFYDDNVVYDNKYAHSGSSELQNNIHGRIKRETQYLGTQTIFTERLSGSIVRGGALRDTVYEQDENLLASRGYIGDAKTLADSNNLAPAIKLVSMQNEIASSVLEDVSNGIKIPQINITASYTFTTRDPTAQSVQINDLTELVSTSPPFADGRSIVLESNNPLIYLEELNTEILVENFDVEVFVVEQDGADEDYRRLYFDNRASNIVNGLLKPEVTDQTPSQFTTSSVEYYFNMRKDYEIPARMICKHLQEFNRENYLIDLDFDCEEESQATFFDIYGQEIGDSEVCLD